MNHSLKNPNNFFIKKFFILRPNLAYVGYFFRAGFLRRGLCRAFCKADARSGEQAKRQIGNAENAVESNESSGK
jgi:hypothetical protein